MNSWLRSLALAFAAGCGGAGIRALAMWGFAQAGWTVLVGSHSALQPGALYPRIVWGGLWGFLFLMPLARKSFWIGGLLAGLIVTLVQWVLLPLWWHHSLHFDLMPLLNALLLNLIWGLATALLLKWL
jgi:hypothetical protein